MSVILKHIHLVALTLSFLVFFVRGILMMRGSAAANKRIALIFTMGINVVLLASGIALAVTLSLSPMAQPWLLSKIIALVAYIGLGVAAFKHPNIHVRKILWLLALVIFAFIVSVAKSKLALGFLAAIF
jgi:uncharacterized membrane protein SirB2